MGEKAASASPPILSLTLAFTYCMLQRHIDSATRGGRHSRRQLWKCSDALFAPSTFSHIQCAPKYNWVWGSAGGKAAVRMMLPCPQHALVCYYGVTEVSEDFLHLHLVAERAAGIK